MAFLSGSIVGLSLFYIKSFYAVYRILSIETAQEEESLTVTELQSLGTVNHVMVQGVGANFELLRYLLDELNWGRQGDVLRQV